MRKLILVSILLLAAVSAFGHAGEVHKYMGTITTLHENGSFMLKATDGKTYHVEVSGATLLRHADGKSATRSDLTVGTRVVATISKDGRTASEIKLAKASR